MDGFFTKRQAITLSSLVWIPAIPSSTRWPSPEKVMPPTAPSYYWHTWWSYTRPVTIWMPSPTYAVFSTPLWLPGPRAIISWHPSGQETCWNGWKSWTKVENGTFHLIQRRLPWQSMSIPDPICLARHVVPMIYSCTWRSCTIRPESPLSNQTPNNVVYNLVLNVYAFSVGDFEEQSQATEIANAMWWGWMKVCTGRWIRKHTVPTP